MHTIRLNMKYYININNIFIFKNIFISTPDSPILNTASHNNRQSCVTPPHPWLFMVNLGLHILQLMVVTGD